jgi:hypothetical protein
MDGARGIQIQTSLCATVSSKISRTVSATMAMCSLRKKSGDWVEIPDMHPAGVKAHHFLLYLRPG